MWITFSASALESGDSISDSPPDFERLADHLEQSAWWRGKPSPSRVWEKRCRKGGWTTVLSGAEISETYPKAICPELTGSPAAIRVSPSPSPDSEKGRTIGDICGPSSNDSFGLFDLEECFSRTWLDTSHSVSVMCLQTWKDLVSDVRLACTQRRKSARRIDENGCSSSAWPTPRAMTGGAESAERKQELGRKTSGGGCLQAAVKAWPTPNAHDSHTGFQNRHQNGSQQKNLHTLVVESLPDSQARPVGSSSTNPRAQLNPDWVETLMGFPIGWTDCGR